MYKFHFKGPKQKRSIVPRKSEEMKKKEMEASTTKKSLIANRWKEVKSSLAEVTTNCSGIFLSNI